VYEDVAGELGHNELCPYGKVEMCRDTIYTIKGHKVVSVMMADNYKLVAKFSILHIINRRICQYYYGGDVINV